MGSLAPFPDDLALVGTCHTCRRVRVRVYAGCCEVCWDDLAAYIESDI